jgi:hypothetical protein
MAHLAIADLDVTLRGELPPDTRDNAVFRLGSVLRQSPEPVLYARVKITRHADPALARPVLVQINLDLNGRPVRVSADGATAGEAIGEAQAKLRRRLPKFARHWQARRGGMSGAAAHEWRHDFELTARPPYFPRPVAEREVRHRSFTLARETLDDAVAEMNQMDYDFHLFTEIGTGQDSVLYRSGPTGYRLAQLRPRPDRIAPHRAPVTVSERRAPRLTVSEAVERLNLLGTPFLFFRHAQSRRGCLLYHRHDGHYGLITG